MKRTSNTTEIGGPVDPGNLLRLVDVPQLRPKRNGLSERSAVAI
jgi:hypothetical protein